MPRVLLVMAKAPVPGKVKTRLCPPARPAQAADIAAAALLDTLAVAAAVPGARTVVALAGTLSEAARGSELRAALQGTLVVGQRGHTLGERIAWAHAEVAARWPAACTVQLGMDTPQVGPATLTGAFAELTRVGGPSALLGPARDGGWWALGLRSPLAARLLAPVPTSRADTGARSVSALRAEGLRVTLLPELTEVDSFADALQVAQEADRSRFAAAVTAQPDLAAASPRRR